MALTRMPSTARHRPAAGGKVHDRGVGRGILAGILPDCYGTCDSVWMFRMERAASDGNVMEIVVKLKDVIIDPAKPVDLTSMPQEKAIALIRKAYGFLAANMDFEIRDERVDRKSTRLNS